MPKIPTYTAQTQPSGTLNVRARPTEGALGGLAELGQTVVQGASIIQQQREKTANVWREKTVAEARGQWAQRIQDMQSSSEPGAPEFTQKFLEEYDGWRKEAIDQAPTEGSRQALDADLERLRSSFMGEAVRFEARAGAEWRAEQVGQTLDTLANTVRARDDMLEDARNQGRELIDSLDVGEAEKAKMRDELIERTAFSAVSSRLDKVEDPEDALDVLIELKDTDKWKSEMSEQQYTQALNRAMRRVDQLEASQDRYVRNVLDERIAEHRAGIDNGLSLQEVENISDPEERETYRKKVELANDIYQIMDDAKSATPEERDQLVADAREALAQAEGPGKESQFYENRARLEASIKSVQQIEKALANDAATYAMQVNESVRDSYERMLENPTPETVEEYATEQIAAQRQLRGSEAPINLLPKNYVATIANKLGDVGTTPSGADEFHAQLMGEANNWGKHWEAVADQLQREGVLGPAQATAAAMARPEQHRAARQLLRASAIGAKELKKNIDVPALGEELKSSSLEALADLQTTLARQPGGKQAFSRFRESVQLLALQYLNEGEGNVTEAVQRAAEEIVMNEFDFMGTFRVPRDIDIDADSVVRGTQLLQSDIDNLDIQPPVSLSGLDEEGALAAAKDVLRTEGQWVNNRDDKGLQLTWPDGPVVRHRNGKPIEYTWHQLDAATAFRRAGGETR